MLQIHSACSFSELVGELLLLVVVDCLEVGIVLDSVLGRDLLELSFSGECVDMLPICLLACLVRELACFPWAIESWFFHGDFSLGVDWFTLCWIKV